MGKALSFDRFVRTPHESRLVACLPLAVVGYFHAATVPPCWTAERSTGLLCSVRSPIDVTTGRSTYRSLHSCIVPMHVYRSCTAGLLVWQNHTRPWFYTSWSGGRSWMRRTILFNSSQNTVKYFHIWSTISSKIFSFKHKKLQVKIVGFLQIN